MVYTGQIKNGVVVLDNGSTLAEGTRVRITALAPALGDQDLPQALLVWGGKGVDLPEDLAVNHDRYLHGQAKK